MQIRVAKSGVGLIVNSNRSVSKLWLYNNTTILSFDQKQIKIPTGDPIGKQIFGGI